MRIIDTERIVWQIMVLSIFGLTTAVGVQSCRIRNKSAEIEQLNKEIAKRDGDIETFLQVRSADSMHMVRQEAVIVEQDRKYASLMQEDANIIRELQSRVQTRWRIRIDTVFIPFATDTSDPDTPDLGFRKDSIAVPQPFHLPGEWLDIAGRVEKGGILLDSIDIPNEQTVTLERQRLPGILPKWKYDVMVQNTNPYLKTSNLKAVVVKPSRHHEYPWVAFIGMVGVVIGHVLTYLK